MPDLTENRNAYTYRPGGVLGYAAVWVSSDGRDYWYWFDHIVDLNYFIEVNGLIDKGPLPESLSRQELGEFAGLDPRGFAEEEGDAE